MHDDQMIATHSIEENFTVTPTNSRIETESIDFEAVNYVCMSPKQ